MPKGLSFRPPLPSGLRCPASDVRSRLSGLRCPVSDVRFRRSGSRVRPQMSGLRCPAHVSGLRDSLRLMAFSGFLVFWCPGGTLRIHPPYTPRRHRARARSTASAPAAVYTLGSRAVGLGAFRNVLFHVRNVKLGYGWIVRDAERPVYARQNCKNAQNYSFIQPA